MERLLSGSYGCIVEIQKGREWNKLETTVLETQNAKGRAWHSVFSKMPDLLFRSLPQQSLGPKCKSSMQFAVSSQASFLTHLRSLVSQKWKSAFFLSIQQWTRTLQQPLHVWRRPTVLKRLSDCWVLLNRLVTARQTPDHIPTFSVCPYSFRVNAWD